MLPLIISLSIVGLLLILSLIVLIGVYNFTFQSPKKWQMDDFELSKSLQYQGFEEEIVNLIKQLREIPYEDAYIKAFDRTKLHARVYKNDHSNQVAILCHGYRGTACRDFSGGATELIKMGLNVVLIDERAHGRSGGHSITFGVKESKDVISWIRYAKETFGLDKEIILIGISMGGASVLFASNKINNVKIIADCPYSSTKGQLISTIKGFKLNEKICFPVLNLASILFCHVNLRNHDAVKNVQESNNKILIIHGEKDSIVPYESSKRVYEANKDKVQYELFTNADHGMSYMFDKERYKKLLENFIK